MKRSVLLLLFLFSSAFFSCGMEVMEHREELGTLKEQSGDEDQKGKIAKEHDAAFKKIEAALIAKEIKTGISSKQIQSRYGSPSTSSPEGDGQRWLYRSLKGGFLNRPWVFLYFDKNGLLLRWDCGHTPACPEFSS